MTARGPQSGPQRRFRWTAAAVYFRKMGTKCAKLDCLLATFISAVF